ncbi:MAG: Asp-tRNA(Asn)/Glu-tRNA(Gln) amidotransferase subunit GatA [Planctomycetota bacterium]
MSVSHQLSARAIAARVQSGELRASDVAQAHLQRIRELDPQLHAFVELWPERALQSAAAIDRAQRSGQTLGPLAGVPVAIKDNLLCQGQVSACGSKMLERFVSPYTATAVARLEQLGAILLGRTNMDEFGMGSSTERSAFGPTRNPWQMSHVPGGSSGGSAAAVAADFCPLALGSDTGGSVRQPAAMCGVTGLKPTYGRVSRSGLVAYASSLDCVGVIGRAIEDVALGLQIAGDDERDSTCAKRTVPNYLQELNGRKDLRGIRVGIVREFEEATGDEGIKLAVRTAQEQLRACGGTIVEVALPSVKHAVATYYLLASTEASSNLARYDGVRYGHRTAQPRRLDELYEQSRSEGFGAEVQLRILLGTFALQKGYQDQIYGQANRVRAMLAADFAHAFTQCDVLASATSPMPSFALGSKLQDPIAMYWCDALTVPASLAGLPALSLPCGFAVERLPAGLQLTAPKFAESLLLQVGSVFQQQTNWHLQRPLS